MRSWIALPPEQRANTDLRILWEGKDLPCAGEPAGGGAKYIKMPPDILAKLSATKLNPAAYRMRAVTWWLRLPEAVQAEYGYVGVLGESLRIAMNYASASRSPTVMRRNRLSERVPSLTLTLISQP